MIKFLYKINKNFDEIPEPYRLLTFLAMVIPGILMFSTPDTTAIIVGAVWVLVMLVGRMIYMHKVWVPDEETRTLINNPGRGVLRGTQGDV